MSGRPPRDDPAICPHCKVDFESAGKMRYRNLSRHIESIHPIKSKNSITQGANCTNGVSISGDHAIVLNLTINSISSSDYTKLLEGLRGIISDCIASKKPMMPEMLSVLHETNDNIVVPNKNKQEVLAKVGNKVEVLPLAEGVKLCVKAFITDGIPKIHEELDKTESTPESEKCKDRLEKEKKVKGDVEDTFKKKLMNENPSIRRKRVKKLQDDEEY